MDLKVSKKERRWMAEGPVDVLIENVCDVYPIFNGNTIMDVEILDDDRTELLDRATFASMKQRGADPVELKDGIQWAEAVIGEVPAPVIVQQVIAAVYEEGPGVRITPKTVRNGSKENLIFSVELTNAV